MYSSELTGFWPNQNVSLRTNSWIHRGYFLLRFDPPFLRIEEIKQGNRKNLANAPSNGHAMKTRTSPSR
ncbi:hypothetical protein DLM78_20720 [Leptospira stimsonii]|uniref:Uncharacterized protein n=1 Tax=Leptospira stimsonii TaxID=2202203 RepID=A0A8B3CK87_9LEPT|nr:hypothetical protein DLM78_20720 [Leptospira stimsonii]